jgi:hypothetical protein
MRFSNKLRLAVVAAVAGFAGVVMVGRGARGQAAPATQPDAATFVTPVFTEDFDSGKLDPAIWDTRIGAGGGGGGAGRRGRGGAATQPAGGRATMGPTAGVVLAAAVAPTPAPAAGGNMPTITVEQDVVAHGKNALLVHYPAGSRAYAFIVASHLPDSLKDHFFGRAYVQFPKAPPNAHDVFITGGSKGFPTSNFLEIGLRQNKAQLSYQQNGAGVTRGETMIPGPAYPIGKWFCLEWEFNDSPDKITIWIDGEKVTDKAVGFQGTTEHLVKGFTDFAFGFRSWGNVPAAFDVYYDDIAFGTGRIGPVK